MQSHHLTLSFKTSSVFAIQPGHSHRHINTLYHSTVI
jgi:hypothetical protein